jgi:biotin operon repressor
MENKVEDRRIKVTPNEILEDLSNGKHMTAQELADEHGVCRATVANKVKQLRKDDNPIIHGYVLISKEWLAKEDNAQELEIYQNWIIAMLKGIYPLAHPIQPLLPLMRRVLGQNLSRDERHQLMQNCAKVTALLAVSEAQEEDES